MAGRRPDPIAGLVMVSTFAWPPHVAPLLVMLKAVGSRAVSAIGTSTNLIPQLSSGNGGVGRNLTDAERAAFLGPYLRSEPRSRFHDLMGSVANETEYLEAVERSPRTTLAGKSVLTIYGEKNDQFGFQAKFVDYFPSTTDHVVPDGNHFPCARHLTILRSGSPIGTGQRSRRQNRSRWRCR